MTGAANMLSTEQVRNEVRYIRSDLLRLLLTTIVVVAFMVAAYYLIT